MTTEPQNTGLTDGEPKKAWRDPVCEEIKVADHTAGIANLLEHFLLHPMAGS